MTPEEKQAYLRAIAPVTSRVRTDVSAVKTSSGSAWTKDPLNATTLGRHVNGGPPRGACPIREGESVTMLALLDLDSHRGETPWAEMAQSGLRIMEALQVEGYAPTAFRSSGGKGIHIFLLWDEPQDAYSVRQMLFDVLGSLGLRSGDGGVAAGQVEVFPKQDSVGVGGFGNQFILPLAGMSEPLDPLFGLEPMGREYALTMSWPSSPPVAVRQAPPRAQLLLQSNTEPIERVRSALMAIPNDDAHRLSYNDWLAQLCAVHEATGGSEEGRELCREWSEQYSEFDPKFFDKRVWDRLRPADKRDKAYTRATLFKTALDNGWVEELTADGFEDVPVVMQEPGAQRVGNSEPVEEDWPAFERDKTGKVKPLVLNLVKALRRPDVCGVRIGLDRFRDEIMLAAPGTDQWRPFGDADYVWLRAHLEGPKANFGPISKDLARDVVLAVAAEQEFDSATMWLENLPDDGESRCETFLIDYFGAEDTPYVRAVSLYLWTALAGRVMQPGCKADMVPILVGEQGLGKSTAISALVPSVDFFAEVSFAEKDDDLSRKMRGKLIAEIGELRGLHTKELEAIKAFITRTHEQWIPKYREFTTLFPRRLVFVGSTNADQFLADATGNRRFLPVRVSRVAVDKVKAVAPLCWAEARRLFQAGGVQWANAERLGKAVHEEYTFTDAWEESVKKWLAAPLFADDGEVGNFDQPLKIADVLVGSLGFDPKSIKRGDEMRMGALLRNMGYSRKRMQINGVQEYVYVPTLPTLT